MYLLPSWSIVYPACAGIDPGWVFSILPSVSLPRMRGDRPSCFGSGFGGSTFTPHARGSTPPGFFAFPRILVYPACAGIDLLVPVGPSAPGSLPRMRGDRPWCWRPSSGARKFTPHARGSTRTKRPCYRTTSVYPACAGIDPSQSRGCNHHQCLPRMRGDRPT